MNKISIDDFIKRILSLNTDTIESGMNTPQITELITRVFIDEFSENFHLKCNNYGNGEFIWDYSVFNKKFIPFTTTNGEWEKNDFNYIKPLLICESELGGNNANSSPGLMSNVLEDFHKLILGRSQYKIMIAALIYSERTIYKNIENIIEVFKKFCITLDADDSIYILIIKADRDGTGNVPKLSNEKIVLKLTNIDVANITQQFYDN